jgi:hypothetical protein
LGGWDSQSNKERPIPFYCPKCKNLRWNQKYTEEEDALFDKIQEQHTLEKVQEESEYEALVAKIKGQENPHAMMTIRYIDPVAELFLYGINPQPDMFELKQLLAIPKKSIEARHKFMLSIIHDRIDNADKYQAERFAKYGDSYLYNGSNDKRFHGQLGEAIRTSKKMAKGCKHTMQEGEQKKQEIRDKWKAAYRQQLIEQRQREQQAHEQYRVARLQENAKALEDREMQRNKERRSRKISD